MTDKIIFEPLTINHPLPEQGMTPERYHLDALRVLASKGVASAFPLSYDFKIHVPYVVDGVGHVHIFHVSETVDIPVLPAAELPQLYSVTAFDEEWNKVTTSYHSQKAPGGSSRLMERCENFQASYAHHMDYLRDIAFEWARRNVERNVTRLAASGQLDERALGGIDDAMRYAIGRRLSGFSYCPTNGVSNFSGLNHVHREGTFYRETATPFLRIVPVEREVVVRAVQRTERSTLGWQQALLSFDIGQIADAVAVRNALMALSGTMEPISDFDDHVSDRPPTLFGGKSKVQNLATTDATAVRDTEFARLSAALRAMTAEMRLDPELSFEVKEACAWFAEGGDIAYVDTAVSMLYESSRDDAAALAAFFDRAGWELGVDPIAAAGVRMNQLMERDLTTVPTTERQASTTAVPR